MKKICIIDYGLGNIRSLYNSIKKIGFFPTFYSESKNENFDLIFIPGVGSFNKASTLLHSPNLKSFLDQSKKILLFLEYALECKLCFQKALRVVCITA